MDRKEATSNKNIPIKQLRGSAARDRFKYWHKNILGRHQYACDSDLDLVEKSPVPFIVARLDFKTDVDRIRFSEVLAYNHLISIPDPFTIPVFIIQSFGEFGKRAELHKFIVFQYLGGDWHPDPPIVNLKNIGGPWDWKGLGKWERAIRLSRQKYMEYFIERPPTEITTVHIQT